VDVDAEVKTLVDRFQSGVAYGLLPFLKGTGYGSATFFVPVPSTLRPLDAATVTSSAIHKRTPK